MLRPPVVRKLIAAHCRQVAAQGRDLSVDNSEVGVLLWWIMDLTKVTTLVVDDIPSMRMMIKAVLRDIGIEDVRQVADYEKAVESLNAASADLIICDWDGRNGGLESQHVRNSRHACCRSSC